MLTPVNEQD